MLGNSAELGEGGGNGEAVPSAAARGGGHEGAAAGGGGGGGSNSGDEGERSLGGNRWPRQETLALLRIRSDMDVAFRDASVKGPLWEEVSRKLGELGYQRSAKKCKEKFENVYKYHRRTKEGRSGKGDGKTYRFFDQLEALDHLNHPPTSSSSLLGPPAQAQAPAPAPAPAPQPTANTVTVPSTTITLPAAMPQVQAEAQAQGQGIATRTTNPTISFPIPTDLLSNSSASSTSSSEEGRRKRKRKWKDLFERLMKQVIEKQEELQKRFLEAIEKREQDRMAREEAWRLQEMQRINREREILAQERSIAAAKDAAVMAFLHKIAEQQHLAPPASSNINTPQPQAQPSGVSVAAGAGAVAVSVQQAAVVAPGSPSRQAPAEAAVAGPQQHQHQHQHQHMHTHTQQTAMKADNGERENLPGASSSRWPKVEVQALIRLRTELDAKYQENGPKGPLWEEISSSMRKLGYNRSAKRCKEKWENINKYFKKVKESNRKRPQDSKTCPYFHQLDALYREKNTAHNQMPPLKPDAAAAPLMVRPEQQWRPPRHHPAMEDAQNDPMDPLPDDQDDDPDDDPKDPDDPHAAGHYEIVPTKPPSASADSTRLDSTRLDSTRLD